MNLYEDRDTRIRAFSSGPMTLAERSQVEHMLFGYSVSRVSDTLVAQLAEAGIQVDTLRSGQRYISSVEA